ncbi:hypothetical protein Olsu_0215 [Olsenella uli DSM 7084]|uniref:Uncharacterized protein n=1 Tax=Olsenella uli (strain ATCC 49627 / DSM 7084 / CCUG 31166 / CIP 109912 / JCM 12494 / LMG 11480 / NCIMB 702895 / VPI D76D-27C) TaxID=633147 RepID=E1QY81_OLSUV|nr:hypothetical protein Olsu_0215 [Olsenella uli DSM 7084]
MRRFSRGGLLVNVESNAPLIKVFISHTFHPIASLFHIDGLLAVRPERLLQPQIQLERAFASDGHRLGSSILDFR